MTGRDLCKEREKLGSYVGVVQGEGKILGKKGTTKGKVEAGRGRRRRSDQKVMVSVRVEGERDPGAQTRSLWCLT